MVPQSSGSFHASSLEETQVQKIYQNFIEGWNKRDARKLAEGFAADGLVIGFDGTHHQGQRSIEAEIGRIFQAHATPPFMMKVKEIRFLTPDVAQLHALVGMIPPQKTELDPKLHAFQVMTVVRRQGQWTIAHMQTTPAQLHGRPEELAAITRELLQVQA